MRRNYPINFRVGEVTSTFSSSISWRFESQNNDTSKSSSFTVLAWESQSKFEFDPVNETEDIRNKELLNQTHTLHHGGWA